MRHETRVVTDVARWEFLRFVKPKQQLVGMLITVVIFSAVVLIGRMGDGASERVRNVAVIGAEHLPLPTAPGARVRFLPHDAADEVMLRQQVRERDLDGVLTLESADRASLFVRSAGAWTGEVETLLTMSRQQYMTERAGLSADVLAAILTPPTLDVVRDRGDARSGRLALIIVIAFMLMAVFTGMAYIFTSITGEKQIRVTEQVISAIPAQAWMDGKILGLVAVSVIGVVGQAIAILAALQAMALLTGGGGVSLPSSLGHPPTVALIVAFGLLGLVFWFAFLGVVAAAIDDPNSSTRSSWMLVPTLATAMAFFIVPDASTRFAQVLSLLPFTSPSAMPARMLAGDATAVEIALSLLILAAGAYLLRIAAGRVLRLGMLMYGKEPSWGEIRRWAMDSRAAS
jgi:ABC-2 type transport system permease protein